MRRPTRHHLQHRRSTTRSPSQSLTDTPNHSITKCHCSTKRIPRRIPDKLFNELFAGLTHNRDRALLAFWVSTAARAEELLSVAQQHADPGEQVIGVTRRGSEVFQWLPASPDAFVWLRLYQEELWCKGSPRGRTKPLWCTLRRPWRPFTYPAGRAMLIRTQAMLGSNYSLHDLRHTGAYRMAQDPEMPITDVQSILGHASLSTTQIYTNHQELHQAGDDLQVAC